MTCGAEIQVENGNWFKAHNVIFEQLAKLRLTGREASCLFFLLRMTYGHQVKENEISLSLWADGTAIDKRHVKNVLDGLVERRIIYRHDGSRGRGKTTIYGFNKYFEQWQTSEKVPPTVPIEKVPSTVPFGENGTSEKVPSTVPEKVPSTVPNKERSRKEAAAAGKSNPQNEPPPTLDPLFSAFVQDYQSIWGLLPASEYVKAEITEWTAKVTRDGWRYALKEAADHNARNWKYLRPILDRIEREGYVAPVSATSAATTFSMEDLL